MYRQTNKVLKNYRKSYTNRNNVTSQQHDDTTTPNYVNTKLIIIAKSGLISLE
jgi:hypothetical protein